MLRRSALALVVACVVLGTNATQAVATATRTDTIKGTEVGYTSIKGVFAGYASGDLSGAWTAVIDHTVLSPNATITGGRFALYAVSDWVPKTVKGNFASGGTVTKTYQAPGCGIQRYAVEGRLTRVGIDGGSGHGKVSATLTHHRHRVLGHCVAYAASISGTVTLTY